MVIGVYVERGRFAGRVLTSLSSSSSSNFFVRAAAVAATGGDDGGVLSSLDSSAVSLAVHLFMGWSKQYSPQLSRAGAGAMIAI